MAHANGKLGLLQRLLPMVNGVTVFDAETQETSYGIWFLGGLPFIFDTHRKIGRCVATIELLTEVIAPVRIAVARVRRFGAACRAVGLMPIPYTGCFFKGNLHVYSFSGPVRGFDVAAVSGSARGVERRLHEGVARLWPGIPNELREAQRELLARRRKVRHPEDLEVLLNRWAEEIRGTAR